jgi:hypothetical protein
MTRSEFKSFVEKTLNELKLTAEIYADRQFPEIRSFQWLRKNEPIHQDRESIVNAIIELTYVDFDKIYPCVDLQVHYNNDQTELIVKGFRANYLPRPFQRGWSNRPGPFIYAISTAIYSPHLNLEDEAFQNKMYELGLWHKATED